MSRDCQCSPCFYFLSLTLLNSRHRFFILQILIALAICYVALSSSIFLLFLQDELSTVYATVSSMSAYNLNEIEEQLFDAVSHGGIFLKVSPRSTQLIDISYTPALPTTFHSQGEEHDIRTISILDAREWIVVQRISPSDLGDGLVKVMGLLIKRAIAHGRDLNSPLVDSSLPPKNSKGNRQYRRGHIYLYNLKGRVRVFKQGIIFSVRRQHEITKAVSIGLMS